MPAFTFYKLFNLLYSPAPDVLVFIIYILKNDIYRYHLPETPLLLASFPHPPPLPFVV